jgi:hypothetical protein
MFRCVIAVAALGALAVTAGAPADEPDKPKGLKSASSFTVGNDLGGGLVTEADGPPVACYGFVKLKDETRYTYFILFKADSKKHKVNSLGQQVGGSVGPNDPIPITIDFAAGDAKLQVTYKAKANGAAGTIESESLTIGDKKYDKDIPPLFLVDLTQEKVSCRAVKGARVQHEGHDLKTLEKTIRQLKEKNPQVKEFFEGKATK